MNLKSFTIKKLYGQWNFTLKFEDNCLILVGENGAGKTTVLQILFLFLSGQWNKLSRYMFDSVSIKLGKETISLSSSEISGSITSVENILNRLPDQIRQRVEVMLFQGRTLDISELRDLCDGYGLSFNRTMREITMISDMYADSRDNNMLEKLNNYRLQINGSQILYLPTYRRIEQDLDDILRKLNIDDNRMRRIDHYQRFQNNNTRDYQNYIELIKFGMKDVNNAIKNKLDHLKDFTRNKLNSLTIDYLEDVVDKKYEEVNVSEIKSVKDDTVKNILDRVDSSILTKNSKERLFETVHNIKNDADIEDHQKVVCHYFSKLLSFQRELENEEQNIRKFCEVSNHYLEDKQLVYTSSSFSFKVRSEHSNEIELSNLSSGEKQIISLFSHLYLSDGSDFFVLIDEPELSLSVPWQRKFLQDIEQSDRCSGLFAVTHSPFIYENELRKYAHGIGEFIREAK